MEGTAEPDALSGLAPLMRVRPELQQLCRFGAQWASKHLEPESPGWAPFHIVTRGRCEVDLQGRESPIAMGQGDALVLPHGTPHIVRGFDTKPFGLGIPPIQTRNSGSLPVKFTADGDKDPKTELLCGRLWFEAGKQNLVLMALPDAIHIPADEAPDATRLQYIVRHLKIELDAARPGAAAIATDLASAFFSMVTRTHFERQPPQAGLLALLRQPQTARAVNAMLHDPARAWTLDELAATANSSRASLVRAFQKFAGIAPVAFLVDLRLQLAGQKLTATSLSIDEVAANSGYMTEKNFVRAFKRRFGMTPSELRGRHTLGRQANSPQ
jgi:AraC family transcriptional regulator, activator of mtrCDE